tara:strand:+ start:599 stop:742 length:144 start_codon:yes stop_codon:yes gene_type:complete
MKTFEISTTLSYKTQDNYRGFIVKVKGKKQPPEKKKEKYFQKKSEKV